MKSTISAGLCVAGLLVLGAVPTHGQSSTAAQGSTSSSSMDQITVTGCVQREADYRKAHDDGRGGVAGTGIGTGNEFILADASISSGADTSATPTGTSGTSSTAYELSGAKEGDVAAYIGQRVEITGTLKNAEVSPSGKPTGGATAGAPPSGVDVTSKDLKLREVEVSSVRAASGTCPAAK